MTEVSFELRGRRVALDEVTGAEREVLETLARKIAYVLNSVICEEHGVSATVMVHGDDIRHLEFRVKGCCSKLIERAMGQLREAPPGDWWLKGPIPDDWWEKY